MWEALLFSHATLFLSVLSLVIGFTVILFVHLICLTSLFPTGLPVHKGRAHVHFIYHIIPCVWYGVLNIAGAQKLFFESQMSVTIHVSP